MEITETNKDPVESIQVVNNNSSKEIPPAVLNDLVLDTLSNIENIEVDFKVNSNQLEEINLLQKEVDLLDYVHKLRSALRTTHANYEVALEALQQIQDSTINAVMLKNHTDVVDTIIKVTKYIGNASEWNISEQEVLKHTEKAAQIRSKAQIVLNIFKSLFTVPDGQTFHEVYIKEVKEFVKNKVKTFI